MTRYSVFELQRQHARRGTVDWRRVADVTLLLQRLRSRPAVRRGAEAVTVSHHVRLRFRDDVDIGMRFRSESRVLVIHQIEAVGRRGGWLSCLCEEQRLLAPESGQ